MTDINVGISLSKEFEGNDPLGHIGVKLPVYLRLLEFCQSEGWGAFVLTRKTYLGDGIFNGAWQFLDGKFEKITKPIKINLVYDRCAGVKFPPQGDETTVWVNELDFKMLAWDKWAAYQVIGEYMPQTLLLENEGELSKVSQITSDWVVLKPFNGLKGIGIFIGPKEDGAEFKFHDRYKRYIAQEFIDTSDGITGLAPGKHDLRIVVINGKVVWCHVRSPIGESFLANAARGGNLTEIDYEKVPANIKNIVDKIAKTFYTKYDNPVYSLDFGVGKDGRAVIFEINDQIGFPKWEMKNRDNFLRELVHSFKRKLEHR